MKDLSKTWVSRKKPFEGFNEKKKENTLLAQSKQLRGAHSLQKQQLNMALIKSKN